MQLEQRIFNDACDSPLTHRLIAEMVKARVLHRIVGDDKAAGAEVFTHDPAAATAAALAEDAQMTQQEREELIGELPDSAEEYCARAFALIDGALAILHLPPEVAGTIDGDLVALFAATLLIADVREAGRRLDEDAGEG